MMSGHKAVYEATNVQCRSCDMLHGVRLRVIYGTRCWKSKKSGMHLGCII